MNAESDIMQKIMHVKKNGARLGTRPLAYYDVTGINRHIPPVHANKCSLCFPHSCQSNYPPQPVWLRVPYTNSETHCENLKCHWRKRLVGLRRAKGCCLAISGNVHMHTFCWNVSTFNHTAMYVMSSELKPQNSGMLTKLDADTSCMATKTETSKYRKRYVISDTWP